MTRELLQQALDALRRSTPQECIPSDDHAANAWVNAIATIRALEAAIAQPAQPAPTMTCQTCEALARTVMMDQTYHDGIKGPK